MCVAALKNFPPISSAQNSFSKCCSLPLDIFEKSDWIWNRMLLCERGLRFYIFYSSIGKDICTYLPVYHIFTKVKAETSPLVRVPWLPKCNNQTKQQHSMLITPSQFNLAEQSVKLTGMAILVSWMLDHFGPHWNVWNSWVCQIMRLTFLFSLVKCFDS